MSTTVPAGNTLKTVAFGMWDADNVLAKMNDAQLDKLAFGAAEITR